MIKISCIVTLTFSLCNQILTKDLHLNHVSIRMPSVHPKMPETYLCTSQKIDAAKKLYVVGFTPNASMNVAHHILLFGCTVPGSEEAVWNCGDAGMHHNHNSDHDHGQEDLPSGPPCSEGSQYVYAWARNAPPLQLPTEVAFEIGKDTGIQFVVLQVHYADVEGFKDGHKDDSGVVLHVTDVPQSKTAGIYLLGTGGSIPANGKEHMETACTIHEATNFHPFAFRTHTHNLGRAVSGYHVRRDKNGTDNWTIIGKKDPRLPQTFYPVENNVTVVNGDVLAARCTMVSDRTDATSIGSTANHEMCNFYVMYWVQGLPLQNKVCFSAGPPMYYWNKGNPELNNIPDSNA